MADQELRDRHNKLLGKIKTRSDGKLELRDAHNSLKGTYDPKRNETRDAHNSVVGKGNLLTTLLQELPNKPMVATATDPPNEDPPSLWRRHIGRPLDSRNEGSWFTGPVV